MANYPRALGTKAETGFVNLLIRSGFPKAERRQLTGRYDRGDVSCGNNDLVFEVKGGKDFRIPKWLRETEAERVNAGAIWGFLIVKAARVGYTNADRWWAIMTKEAWDQFNEIHKFSLHSTAVEYLQTSTSKHTFEDALMQAQATRGERMALDHMDGWETLRWYTTAWFKGMRGTPDYMVMRVADLLDMLTRCGFTTSEVES